MHIWILCIIHHFSKTNKTSLAFFTVQVMLHKLLPYRTVFSLHFLFVYHHVGYMFFSPHYILKAQYVSFV